MTNSYKENPYFKLKKEVDLHPSTFSSLFFVLTNFFLLEIVKKKKILLTKKKVLY